MFKKFFVLILTVLVLFMTPFTVSADCQSECSEMADENAPSLTYAFCTQVWCGQNYPGWGGCYDMCYDWYYETFWWYLYDMCADECQ